MHILLAPDSFKGSLYAFQVCQALEVGARRVFPAAEFTSVALADGGEGTLDALLVSAGGRRLTAQVTGPLGDPVSADWGVLSDGRAVIEMAAASGLTLVDADHRDALRATSRGTGELIQAALDFGCRDFLICVGGSATTDGGSGALSALGAFFRNDRYVLLPPGGGELHRLSSVDIRFLDPRLAKSRFTVLSDVTNPLTGPTGAAHVYGPQKGADPAAVELLDQGLVRLARVTGQALGNDYRDRPGAGAAGGMGFGLMAFLKAELKSGIDVVLEAADLAGKLETADLVLTGEGSLDSQTLSGKTIAGVARHARAAKGGRGVPVIAFGGAVALTGAQMDELGLLTAFPISDGPRSLQYCLENAPDLLAKAVERGLRLMAGTG